MADHDNEGDKIACKSIQSLYANVSDELLTLDFEGFGACLMHDHGRCLTDLVEFGNLSIDTAKAFKNIIYTAMYLSRTLPHGDVLPHNIVFDESTKALSLIDIDEGSQHGQSLLTRKNEYGGLNDWYTGLSYPNVLVEDAQSYTKAQLVASFFL